MNEKEKARLGNIIRKDEVNTVFRVGDIEIGKDFFIIAGPCAIENEKQYLESAKLAIEGGAKMLRAGAYKPRTCPDDFQGLKEEGLRIAKKAKEKYNVPLVAEVTSATNLELMKDIDILQIGARNSQNYELLKDVAKLNKPVILKRGMAMTLFEFLGAAKYLYDHGTKKIILCERGIRTFNTDYRNTLDINAIIMLLQLTHLPIIGDPSHATGIKEMVLPASKAITAAGACGLMIELHNDPDNALCDGKQSITNLTPITEACKKINDLDK